MSGLHVSRECCASYYGYEHVAGCRVNQVAKMNNWPSYPPAPEPVVPPSSTVRPELEALDQALRAVDDKLSWTPTEVDIMPLVEAARVVIQNYREHQAYVGFLMSHPVTIPPELSGDLTCPSCRATVHDVPMTVRYPSCTSCGITWERGTLAP